MPIGANFARFVLTFPVGYAAFAQASNYPVPLHIAVQARTLEGAPIQWLQGDQFDVSVAGTRLPVISVRTAQPRSPSAAPPTFALLMIAPTSYYSSENAIAALLTQYLPEDFGSTKFAVLEKSGELTPYAGSRSQLVGLLHNFHNPVRRKVEALDELGRKEGRRVLIYLTENGTDIPITTRRNAELAAALTYQVGGDRGKNYVIGDEGFAAPVPATSYMGENFHYGPVDQGGVGILAPPPAPVYSVTKSIREVLVVRTLKDAYRSMNDDGKGYYDVTVNSPEGARCLDLKLDLKYNYQLTAQDYAPEGHIPPELHVGGKQLVPLLNRRVVNRR